MHFELIIYCRGGHVHTHHVGEGVAARFVRDAAVGHLYTSGHDIGLWIVQEDEDALAAEKQATAARQRRAQQRKEHP